MFIFYATRDGQARRIATHISDRLAEQGLRAAPHDLATGVPTPAELAHNPLIMLVASVRYGRHLPEAGRLLAAYGKMSSPPPLAVASVNLTARKAGKCGADTNPYLRKLIGRYAVKPALAAAFAGRLDYPRYGWVDRQVIRFIMLLTGGPTDPATSLEYTSWGAVDEFASRIVEFCGLGRRA